MPVAGFSSSGSSKSGLVFVNDILIPKSLIGYLNQTGMFYIENEGFPLVGGKPRQLYEVKQTEYGPIFTSPRLCVYKGDGDRTKFESWNHWTQFVLTDGAKMVGTYYFGQTFDDPTKNYKRKVSISPSTLSNPGLLATLYANAAIVNTILDVIHIFGVDLSDEDFKSATSNEVLFAILNSKIEEIVGVSGLEIPENVEYYDRPIAYFKDSTGFVDSAPQMYWIDEDNNLQPFGKSFEDCLREYAAKNAKAISKVIPQTLNKKPNPKFALWQSILTKQVGRQIAGTLREYTKKSGETDINFNLNALFSVDTPGLTPPTMKDFLTKRITPMKTEVPLTNEEFSKYPRTKTSGPSSFAGVIYFRIDLNNVCTKMPSIGAICSVTKVYLQKNVYKTTGIDDSASTVIDMLGLTAEPEDVGEEPKEPAEYTGGDYTLF